MKHSFFQSDSELLIYDTNTFETLEHISNPECPTGSHEYLDDSSGIQVYSTSKQKSQIVCDINGQLHCSMAVIKKIEKAEILAEKRRQKRSMDLLRLDKLKVRQILGKGGYAHVQLGIGLNT